eukprot:GILI01014004.1.p1 GENE.GILI01014004.1~~GILI01014004.1.p1  ORF type:complete len:315 (+),score=67.05 GILI01014004.1:60-947(+)
MSKPVVRDYFDKNTNTWTYLVIDPSTKHCALIDTVLDFDMPSASTTTASADALIKIIKDDGLTLDWILETHVHADHLTASQYIKKVFDGSPKVAIGEHIKKVLAYWVPVLGIEADTPLDGSQFDHLFKDGEEFQIGSINVKVLQTPGHTPACVTYICGEDVAFVGDTIFMPRIGTARTDFPGGSAAEMFDSCRMLMAKLPPSAHLHVGHDYPESGKAPEHSTTISDHIKTNAMMNERVTKDEFIEANKEELPVPRLLLPALQVNLRAGRLGTPQANGKQFLMIPLNLFNKTPCKL